MRDSLYKPVLLTRENHKNRHFIKYIKKYNLNFEFISSPLLKIEFLKVNIPLGDYKTLIFTSSNAVKSAKSLQFNDDITAYCVGSETAKEAKKLGFNIYNSEGNSQDLLRLIRESGSKKLGKILYLRGKQVSLDIAKKLRAERYEIVDQVVYKQKSLLLKKSILDKLSNGAISDAVFFSSNTASYFAKAVSRLDDNFTAYCLSEKIAKTLSYSIYSS